MRINKLYHFIVFFSIVLLIVGCSSKKYFEPKNVSDKVVAKEKHLPSSIKNTTSSGAILSNGAVITKDGEAVDFFIPNNFMLLNNDDSEFIILSSSDGLLKILNRHSKKTFFSKKFKYIPVAATLSPDNKRVSIVFSSNKIMVYDLVSDKAILTKSYQEAYGLNYSTANPYYLNDLIIFPVLDGRIAIVDKNSNSVLRDVIISSEPYFNNIMFLDVFNDVMIAATRSRVISIGEGGTSFLDQGIKYIAIRDGDVFLLTSNGRVMLLDLALNEKKSKEFEYANFSGYLLDGSHFYVFEKTGYLIEMSYDLNDYTIYNLPWKVDSYLFTSKGKAYFEDKYIDLSH